MSHGTHDYPARPPLERCLNESWPRDPKAPRDRDPIAVRARVVWSVTGEEWQDGDAIRWTGRHVFVRLTLARNRTLGVWLDAGDVQRR